MASFLITRPLPTETKQQFSRNIAVATRRSAGPAVLPVLHPHLRHHQGGPRGTDHGTAAGLHGQRAVRPHAPETEDREILAAAAGKRSAGEEAAVPGGMPAYLANLYDVPLLTREQEAHLFRKMNYLKYKAGRLRDTLDVDRPKSRLMGQIEKLYDESVATKNQIIRANLRLVVSIAKRYVGPAGDFFELVSDGNMSLLRAVEKFDVSQGNRFSTYASWAIMKNFARSIPDVLRHRDRFPTSHAEISAPPRTSARTSTSRSRLKSSGSRRWRGSSTGSTSGSGRSSPVVSA